MESCHHWEHPFLSLVQPYQQQDPVRIQEPSTLYTSSCLLSTPKLLMNNKCLHIVKSLMADMSVFQAQTLLFTAYPNHCSSMDVRVLASVLQLPPEVPQGELSFQRNFLVQFPKWEEETTEKS